MIQVSGGSSLYPNIDNHTLGFLFFTGLINVLNGIYVYGGFHHRTDQFGVFNINGAPGPGPGTARNAGAVYTATEQGMIQDMYNILRACGFLQP